MSAILGRFVLLECCLMVSFVAFLYPLSMFAGGLSFRNLPPPRWVTQMVALSTRSSLAALPAMLTAAERMAPANQMPARAILPLAVNISRCESHHHRALPPSDDSLLLVGASPPAGRSTRSFLLSSFSAFPNWGFPAERKCARCPPIWRPVVPMEAVILL